MDCPVIGLVHKQENHMGEKQQKTLAEQLQTLALVIEGTGERR
jgi:hypothetical protein